MIPASANPLLLRSAATQYQVSRSLRFNSSDSAYCVRTPASSTNRQKYTWSGWVKRSTLATKSHVLFTGYSNDFQYTFIAFNSSDQILINDYQSSANQINLVTTSVYRDPSAWYHIVLAVDTTIASPSSDRVKLYVNGTQVTNFSTSTYPSQNLSTNINNNTTHYLGHFSIANATNNYFNGYLADIHFIDGQALTPSSFGETDANGEWQPKAYSGTYGTNGFKLDFSNNASTTTLGYDNAPLSAATGALPILNTSDTNGHVVDTGTRTDTNAANLVLAVPMNGANNGTTFTDQSAAIRGSGSAKTITVSGNTITSTAQSRYYGSSGYFDTAGDVLTVSAGADFAYGTGDFSVEAWIYPTQAAAKVLYSQSVSGTNYFVVFRESNGTISFYATLSGGGTAITTTGTAALNAWSHVAVTRQSGTVRIFINGVQSGSGTNSTNLSNTTYVPTIGAYTHGTGDSWGGYISDFRIYKGVAKYTATFTPPLANDWTATNFGVASSNANVSGVGSNPNNMFDLNVNSGTAGAANAALTWNGSINLGPGKYYLILNAYGSSSQGPINGASLTVGGTVYTSTYSQIRANTDIHNQVIGSGGTFTSTADGRRTNLTASGSGSLTQISATATGGGFANLFYAVVFIPSGVSDTAFANHVIVHNITETDSFVDTPTSYGTDTGAGGEVRGNYCVMNPLPRTSQITFTNGNLDVEIDTGTFVWTTVAGTIAVNSGKWYFEATCVNRGGAEDIAVGIVRADQNLSGYFLPGDSSRIAYAYFDDGRTRFSTINSGQPVSYGASYTNGDVIGVAYDATAGTLVFYKNGVSQGTAFSSISTATPWLPCVSGGNTNDNRWTLNFGQRPFAYPVSGFNALCDTNLTAPVIAKPSTVMDVIAYSGSGASRTFTDLSYSPDLVWIKHRSGANNHRLYDAVRGTTKALYSNLTNSEGTDSTGLTAFTSNGFTLGDGDAVWNASGQTYVAWCWDAGSSTVTNTQGSITSQVRANASAGFSVVTYTAGATNATVGHGLNVTPELIIAKSRTDNNSWPVYHKSLGKDKFLVLSLTDAAGTNTNYWGVSGPSSTTFGLATSGFANNTGNMVAYCFAPVAGYSAMGSYVGNGSTDGIFQWCGFRPRWIMVKNTSLGTINDYWVLFDAARNGYNVTEQILIPNLSDAEGTSTNNGIDLLSNGFKWRATHTSRNASGSTYVWVAFAESPFQYARAR